MTSGERPTPSPTHAGGVVHRVNRGVREFLVITARRKPDDWVLPKGHLEPGETPEAAAVREVSEETGIRATVELPLVDVSFRTQAGEQRVRFFLMRPERTEAAAEARALAWLPFAAASQRLTFEEAREVLRAAAAAVGEAP